MKYQKVVILVAIFLFTVPFVFSQNCQPNTCDNTGTPCTNVGQIRSDYCTCAYSELAPSTSCWFPVTDIGKIYRIGTGDSAFDVVSNGQNWYGCDAEANHNVHGFPTANGIEAGNLQIVSITTTSTHEYVCYKKNSQEKWGECYGNDPSGKFSTTGGTAHPVGGRVPDIPDYYYCTQNEKWVSDITDQPTCNAANSLYGGVIWTGSYCCGEKLNDYYNDATSCWNGMAIPHNKRISDINLVKNGDFEDDTKPTGNPDGMPDYWSYITEPIGGTSSDAFSGIKSYTIQAGANIYGIKSSEIFVRPNTRYMYSVYAKAPFGLAGEAKIYIGCYDDWHYDNEAIFGLFSISEISNSVLSTRASNWLPLSGTFSTLSNTKHCHVLLYTTSGSTGTVYFDLAELKEDNQYVLNFQGFRGCRVGDTDFGVQGIITQESYCTTHSGVPGWFCSFSKNGWSNSTADLELGDNNQIPFANNRVNPSSIFPVNLLINPLFR